MRSLRNSRFWLKRNIPRGWPVLLALIFSVTLVTLAYAAQRELKVESEKVDVVLVMDASGSMKVTDPLGLRYEGAELFTQFLKPGDRFALVEFAEKAKVLRPLTDYEPAKEKEVKALIRTVSDTGEYTDLLSGIKEAASLLASGGDDARKLIILLSDGKMEPSPESGSSASHTATLLDEVAPELKTKGITVHSLAFSEQADKDLLAQIALGTDGVHWFTPTSDKVHQSFADLFLVVKKPQVLPLTKKGFNVDEEIEEATFYINRDGEGELLVISPSGQQYTFSNRPEEIKWFKGEKFEVVTVKSPEPGLWNVGGPITADGFATVLTDLKLVSEWPPSLYAGDQQLVQARLYDSEKPVILPEMGGVVKYAFQITPTDKVAEPVAREFLNDDGENGDLYANDGIYSAHANLTDAGEYRLRVVARGPTFEREQNIPFRVRPQLITLSITETDQKLSEDEDHGDGHGEKKHAEHGGHDEKKDDHGDGEEHASQKVVQVQLAPDLSAFKKVELELFAVTEKKVRLLLPVFAAQKDKSKYYSPVSALPQPGTYLLKATVTGTQKKGGTQKVSSHTLEYKHSTDSHHDSEEKVVVVSTKKPKEAPPPAWPWMIGVLLVHAVLAKFSLKILSKAQSGISLNLPDLTPSEVLLKEMESFRRSLENGDVDLSDARFSQPLAPLPEEQKPAEEAAH